jgi:carbonic anhydrase/acetyltransferase-like protein (isoleucine patch superfamily)
MILPFEGKMPRLHENVFVVDSAIIIGDVEIGKDSSVWFNTVIRGDVNYIRIGERTNIQDLSMLHVEKGLYPLVIGNEVTIGHSVTLHGCRIKDRCLIGMGVIILNNAEIGEESIIGAGSLITEHTVIPPRSLVIGSPGRVKRQVTEEELSWINRSAQNYLNYVNRYRGK